MKCNALMTQLILFFNIIKNHRQEVMEIPMQSDSVVLF